MKTLWSSVKEAINSYDIDQHFTRKGLRKRIREIHGTPFSQASMDHYRLSLTNIKVLTWIDEGLYQKKQDIPDELTTTIMHKIEIELRWRPSWKDWFLKDALKERIRFFTKK